MCKDESSAYNFPHLIHLNLMFKPANIVYVYVCLCGILRAVVGIEDSLSVLSVAINEVAANLTHLPF